MEGNVFDELVWREMIFTATDDVRKILSEERVNAYIGFDPTASSLHVGSLLPIMCLVQLQRYGHRPIALLGGGTALIGDPSGKDNERQLLSAEIIEFNLHKLKRQLQCFIDFEEGENRAIFVNNEEWLNRLPLVDFLRDIGKHFSVNNMLAKESVRRRLDRENGISFTEFSYSLMQAYDFLVLYDRYNCKVQMGGSDQWGNILSGIELIRRVRQQKVHGLVFPLVTTSTGTKFGKTEENTIWLDPDLTSPFRFYQFWYNSSDQDVIRYLKYFSTLSSKEIHELGFSLSSSPEKREPHKMLARIVTSLVHGETALRKAEQASHILFGAAVEALNAEDILDIFKDVPFSLLSKVEFEGTGMPLSELAVYCKLVASKSEARRLIQSGGLYVNNRRISDVLARINISWAVDGEVLILRKGAREYHVIKLVY